MKKSVEKLIEADVVREFPINDRIAGWFFNCTEASNSAWTCKGTDLWGRSVGSEAGSFDKALESAIDSARRISVQLGEYEGMTVNERLFASGLFESFEAAANARDRTRLIEILQATGLTVVQSTSSVNTVLNNPSKYGY